MDISMSIKYTYKYVNPNSLKLGGQFKYVWYDWRPYKLRTKESQRDYDKLENHLMETKSMINPLIVFRGCVLIGMRRCEIAVKHGWKAVPIWEITTDISEDRQPDRVFELRNKYKEVNY